VAFCMSVHRAQAEVVAKYIFGTTSGASFTRVSTDFASRSTATDMTDGRASFAVGSSSGNPAVSYAVTTIKLSSSEPDAVTSNQYGAFTVTATNGTVLNLTNLSFQVQDSAADVVGTWFVRSSIDGFAANLGSFPGTTNWTTNSIALPWPAYQSRTSVTFRFYAYNSGPKSTGKSVRLDNVVLADDAEPVTGYPGVPRVLVPWDTTYIRHSEGTAIELSPGGRILLAWSRFGNADNGDNTDATIVMAHSDDGGYTWSMPEPLPVGTAGINIMQAAFLKVGSRILLIFSVRDATNSAGKFMIESSDSGVTWSPRVRITPPGSYITGPNDRAIQLSTGRILLPCHTIITTYAPNDDMLPLMAWSDDGGTNWITGVTLTNGAPSMTNKVYKIHEPAVVERTDGSLWMLCRSTVGVFFEATSTNGGTSWSPLLPTPIDAMSAPPYLRRLDDGRIARLWNPPPPGALTFSGKRTTLRMAYSHDEGLTWQGEITMADDGGESGYCYPWLLQLPTRGELLVFFAQTPDIITPANLVMVRMSAGVTARGTAIAWLNQCYGISTNFVDLDLADTDGDRQPAWMEYRAGTDPTNSLSAFWILRSEITGGTNTLWWYGTTNSGVITPFVVEMRTNLTEGSWIPITAALPRSPDGTNSVNLPIPPSEMQRLYRITIP
jgi:hypothetical protein